MVLHQHATLAVNICLDCILFVTVHLLLNELKIIVIIGFDNE